MDRHRVKTPARPGPPEPRREDLVSPRSGRWTGPASKWRVQTGLELRLVRAREVYWTSLCHGPQQEVEAAYHADEWVQALRAKGAF